MFIDGHTTRKKAWMMYLMQIIRQWSVGVLFLLNSVTTFFFYKPGLVGLMFFLHISSPMFKHVKPY